MSSELRDLYQTVILDHYKKPRNFGVLEGANCEAEGRNPLCGDHVKVYARVDGDTVGGRRLRRFGLRDLHRLRVADDADREGQDARRRSPRSSRTSTIW